MTRLHVCVSVSMQIITERDYHCPFTGDARFFHCEVIILPVQFINILGEMCKHPKLEETKGDMTTKCGVRSWIRS